ncbi:hypothetical protein [Pseudoxanthomonas winnipegensis]|uniref:hypothetical protein n=1 Tax=Pseudoxanthomonas winnipegensis TaxID=2480810 RepID=UPI0030F3D48D
MTATSHYHDRIARATERLAQLQAKELLADQRRESRLRKEAKRDEIQRRQRVANLIFSTGAHGLPDAELEALLRGHMAARHSSTLN